MIDVKQCGMVAEDRSLVMFEDNELILCRGDVQNLVGIHPTEHVPNFDGTFFAKDAKDSMLQEFDHYHPDILKLFNLAEEVKCWPLYIHEPLDSWQYGKVLLIGDAAHPVSLKPKFLVVAVLILVNQRCYPLVVRAPIKPSKTPKRLVSSWKV